MPSSSTNTAGSNSQTTPDIPGVLVATSTPGMSGVVWLFDPAVFVDDDGTGYLYAGGGIPGGSNPKGASITDALPTTLVISVPNFMTRAVLGFAHCSCVGFEPPGMPPPAYR